MGERYPRFLGPKEPSTQKVSIEAVGGELLFEQLRKPNIGKTILLFDSVKDEDVYAGITSSFTNWRGFNSAFEFVTHIDAVPNDIRPRQGLFLRRQPALEVVEEHLRNIPRYNVERSGKSTLVITTPNTYPHSGRGFTIEPVRSARSKTGLHLRYVGGSHMEKKRFLGLYGDFADITAGLLDIVMHEGEGEKILRFAPRLGVSHPS